MAFEGEPVSLQEERDYEQPIASSPQGLTESQVDVPESIAKFKNTEIELQEVIKNERIEIEKGGRDGVVEKGGLPEGEIFDLADYMQATFMGDQFGGQKKRMGVVFKNLTVVGEGADATSIPNLWTPIETIGRLLNPANWFKHKTRGTDFDILHNLTGVVKDGEMLLVLGRPGSGCSTFLRVIANLRSTYKAVYGDVSYGGISAADFKKFAGENLYTAEEDVHYPTLTVKQTLKAALECKAPHKRVRQSTRAIFVSKVMYMLLKMFGLTKQADTVVGNEWIRGLSGGERKRLTIAEAMTARSAINCWDCTTRGLDSASALDYVKSLRIMSDTLKRTNIASLYQASEDMYNLFDKVMILDKGMCVYFGPTSLAKKYFEDMGFMCEARKSTPDFLTGITNANERKVKEEYKKVVPRTPAELAERFENSEIKRQVMQEIGEYEKFLEHERPAHVFEKHVHDAKAKGTNKNSIYITNFWQQLKAMFVREYQLIYGDTGALVMRVFAVLSKAFVYATVYLFLPLNSGGIFSRGGALFNSVLFNSMMCLAELPNAVRGRRVLQKHKTYAMYHPSAYHLARVASDIPITMIQVTLYTLCAYFLFGFQLTPGHFFTFLFTLFLTSVAMLEFFRICVNITSNYFAASQIANISLIVLLIYSGFIIVPTTMKKWFKWIYWANPMAYTYKALFLSEMHNLKFPCKGDDVIPHGPIYTNSSYQACSIPGHKDGTLYVLGQDYLDAQYGYPDDQKAISIVAVFLFWIAYIVINCVVMEYVEFHAGGYTRQVYKKGKAPKQNDTSAVSVMDEEDEGAEIRKIETFEKRDRALVANSNTTFTWNDMSYYVPIKGGTKQLLDKVEGWIKPGQMTALMGASGAGKTTLLDVLAQRKTIGKIEGTILLDGEPLHKDFERLTGYVEQMDVHNPSQTVREALRFSARMRQDPSIPLSEKYEYVEKILQVMEMTNLGDALIGDLETGWGISVEERKRLTIGMELVGRPKILFLDEPTSGLDAQSSYNIVKFIRKLADQGMPLVCTIHQPSSVLFEYFDRLLLLTHGGRTVYFGDIGENSRTMLEYFGRFAEPCRIDENPAEYILKVVNGKDRVQTVDWAEEWRRSEEKAQVQRHLEEIRTRDKQGSSSVEHKEFATGKLYQFWEVYKRMNLVWWRSPTYNWGRFANAVIISLFTGGFSFFRLSDSVIALQSRVFAVLGVVLMGNSLILLAQPMFMRQRQFFRREYASKFYSWWTFAISIILTELPYLLCTAGVFVLCSYWTVGLESTAINGFYFFLGHVLFMFFAVSFGQTIAAFCNTLLQASILNPFFTPFLILFAGAIVPPQNMPKFWREFMYNIDPFHYFLEGVLTSVLKDVQVKCKQNELIQFTPDPSFGNCGNYMNDFLQDGNGYVLDPNSTDSCSYCPYKNGAEFYHEFGWHYENRWRDIGILCGYFCSNVCLIILFVYLFRKPKR